MLARRSRLLPLFFCALVMSGGIVVTHAQTENAAALAIGGDVPHPLTLSEADLQSMPRVTMTFTDRGVTTTYEGVRVSELLKRAGVPLGADLRGPALATQDTRGARSIRMLQRLEVVRLRK